MMLFWWLLRKVLGIEQPSYYIGGLSNLEVDEELEEDKESEAA